MHAHFINFRNADSNANDDDFTETFDTSVFLTEVPVDSPEILTEMIASPQLMPPPLVPQPPVKFMPRSTQPKIFTSNAYESSKLMSDKVLVPKRKSVTLDAQVVDNLPSFKKLNAGMQRGHDGVTGKFSVQTNANIVKTENTNPANDVALARKTLRSSAINANNFVNTPVSVVRKDKVHASVPIADVRCYINTSDLETNLDTKKVVIDQIHKKIYKKQLFANIRMAPTKYADQCTSTDAIDSQIKSSGLKIDMDYFTKKNMQIDDFDFDIDAMDMPMRSSTLTPSMDSSTIVAGHLDYSIIDDIQEEYKSSEESTSDGVLSEYFAQFPPKTRLPVKSLQRTSKETPEKEVKQSYCKTWMQNEDGISPDNNDPPPSLYTSSVTLSDSQLDTTSISCNINAKNYPNTGEKKTKISSNRFESYQNTEFM